MKVQKKENINAYNIYCESMSTTAVVLGWGAMSPFTLNGVCVYVLFSFSTRRL